MDWIGSWSLSLAVTALMLGLSFGGRLGWTSPVCLASWIVTAVMVCGFVVRIRTAAKPLIPPHYFKKRNFVMPMLVRASANFANFGAFFLFPILMEQGYHYSVGRVGAISIARPLVFSICSPIAGYVAMRIGERVSAIAGMTFLTLSLALFALLQPSTGAWVVVIALALSGLGMGVAMPSSSAIMSHAVQENEFGVMSAAQMLAMQVGEVAGIQILETVQNTLQHRRGLDHVAYGSPQLLATFHWPFVIGTVIGGLGILAALSLRQFTRDQQPEPLAWLESLRGRFRRSATTR
jgi:MFS family permease